MAATDWPRPPRRLTRPRTHPRQAWDSCGSRVVFWSQPRRIHTKDEEGGWSTAGEAYYKITNYARSGGNDSVERNYRGRAMSGKRKALTGVAALTLFDIVAAHAQPVPPVPPVPLFSWTGFYFGGHAGYRLADVNGSTPVGVTPNFNQFFGPPSFNPLFAPID